MRAVAKLQEAESTTPDYFLNLSAIQCIFFLSDREEVENRQAYFPLSGMHPTLTMRKP